MLRQGYVLPLPAPYSRHNQCYEADNAIAELLFGGYVKVAKEQPAVCSPLSVVVVRSIW